MQLPYEYLLGWRYTRAGKATRRNGFISFISAASMIGIALGVAALIIVLSVMNGFQKEVRDRMLSVVSHVEVMSADGAGLDNVQEATARLRQMPGVVGAAPYVSGQALVALGENMRGAMVRGVDPQQEKQVTDVSVANQESLNTLVPGEFHAVVGIQMARRMHLEMGDQITLIVPSGQVTPAGVMPRLKQVTVTGTFESGHFEFDANMVMLHVDDAQTLFQLQGPAGVRLRLQDLHQAPTAAWQISQAMGPDYAVSDWTQQNRAWFAAVQVEKRMMFIILTLIVAVAAFNLVSTLVMSVQDKRADIAILRTLGAAPRSIMRIFMVQGATSGVIGTLAGLGLGLLVAFNIDVIVPFIERMLGTKFLPQDIYLISTMPSSPQASDIVPIVIVSLILAFLATLYPSWRASRVNPAQAVRYE